MVGLKSIYFGHGRLTKELSARLRGSATSQQVLKMKIDGAPLKREPHSGVGGVAGSFG